MKKQHYITLAILLVFAGVYASLKWKASLVEQSKVVEPIADVMTGHLDYVLSETNEISTLSIDGTEIEIHRSDYETESEYQRAIELTILNYQAIKLHNDCIEKAISTATKIEISSRSPTPSEDDFSKTVELTDQDKIKWLLERFKLPTLIKTTAPRYHNCAGNIELTIFCGPNEKYHMGYDHGHTMMPIMHRDLAYRQEGLFPRLMPGNMSFKDGVTTELNLFLNDLGFSEEEIGIGETK